MLSEMSYQGDFTITDSPEDLSLKEYSTKLEKAFCRKCSKVLPVSKFRFHDDNTPYDVCDDCLAPPRPRGSRRIKTVITEHKGRKPGARNVGVLANMELVKSGKKQCGKCGVIKPLGDFHKHKSRIGGVCNECIECVSARNKQRYAAARFGPDRMKSLKSHAKRLKLPADITAVDLEWLWERQKGLCYYTKILMVFTIGKWNTVSVDRINPKKGYLISNLCLCCDYINTMKGKFSYEVFLDACLAVVENALDVKEDPELQQNGEAIVHYRSLPR
jgi:hypothetical protein